MNDLTFKDCSFDVIDRDGQVWIRGPQIGVALGYRNPRKKIAELYARHADEFTESMTRVVDVPTPGGIQNVRVFSLRGAHLLGMFARTERAKEFRRWVLDILDGIARSAQHAYQRLAVVERAVADMNASASEGGRRLAFKRWHSKPLEAERDRLWHQVQPMLPSL